MKKIGLLLAILWLVYPGTKASAYLCDCQQRVSHYSFKKIAPRFSIQEYACEEINREEDNIKKEKQIPQNSGTKEDTPEPLEEEKEQYEMHIENPPGLHHDKCYVKISIPKDDELVVEQTPKWIAIEPGVLIYEKPLRPGETCSLLLHSPQKEWPPNFSVAFAPVIDKDGSFQTIEKAYASKEEWVSIER